MPIKKDDLKLEGDVFIPEWGPLLPAAWRRINGDRIDAESIAKWFFQVDDPRQEECRKLVEAAFRARLEDGLGGVEAKAT